jgi:AraC-like DNA-binding protein
MQGSAGNNGVLTPPRRLVISTEHLPARDRFAFMREELCAHHLNFDLTRHEKGSYDATVEAAFAGEVMVSTFRGGEMAPASWTRSRKALTDADGGCMIYVMRAGRVHLRQGDVDETVQAGAGCLFHVGEASTFEVPSGGISTLAVKVPEHVLRPALKPGQRIAPRTFAPSAPLMTLLAGYAETVFHLPPETELALRVAAGAHLADLVTLALGPNGDATERARDGGLRAARTDAVLKAIEANFRRADISATGVGKMLGISDRQVHRLLEATPKSFYEHVLEARLQEARRQLGDPSSHGSRIAEIAANAGFGDVTYFNRVFRTRFGETPAGVRGGRFRPERTLPEATST